mmetsp:Transcript_48387/g.138230  ORF Transcript_48387/g.138230 Transcript_48387/m.138230 type:complete len:206 (-) Transcript_48387:158-775(-)
MRGRRPKRARLTITTSSARVATQPSGGLRTRSTSLCLPTSWSHRRSPSSASRQRHRSRRGEGRRREGRSALARREESPSGEGGPRTEERGGSSAGAAEPAASPVARSRRRRLAGPGRWGPRTSTPPPLDSARGRARPEVLAGSRCSARASERCLPAAQGWEREAAPLAVDAISAEDHHRGFRRCGFAPLVHRRLLDIRWGDVFRH